MNSLVVYDSKFGNTRKLAEIIAMSLAEFGAVVAVGVESPEALRLEHSDLLVVGGPTQAHGLSPAMRSYLDRLSSGTGKAAATFDTRLKGPGFLWGSAARAINEYLEKHDFAPVAPPESFIVVGMQVPHLLDGETERAARWARHLGTQVRLGLRERSAV